MSQNNYSLMRGGLVHQLLSSTGLLRHGTFAFWVVGLLLAVSFLPLMALTAQAGTLLHSGKTIPLLKDYGELSRFLLALPLLILAVPKADAMMRAALRQLAHSGLVHAKRQPVLDEILDKVRALRDSIAPELACLALAIVPSILSNAPITSLPGMTDWRSTPDGQISAAGHWFDLVSVPVFRFVALLWLWRFVLWIYLLWRLSRTQLELHPAHPDGAGGLSFLGMAQERFGVLALAGGIVLCGACINHIQHMGEGMPDMKHLMLGYIVGSTLLLLSPLLLLTPLMVRAKRHALLRFDALGNRMVHEFDRRWRRGQAGVDDESMLDKGDASALADFTGVYGNVAPMSVIPLTRWNLLNMLLHAGLPLLPVVFFALSLDQLAQKLMQILV